MAKYKLMRKSFAKKEIRTQDLWHGSPMPYPLHHAYLMKNIRKKNVVIQ
jgi:hypothetical protein